MPRSLTPAAGRRRCATGFDKGLVCAGPLAPARVVLRARADASRAGA